LELGFVVLIVASGLTNATCRSRVTPAAGRILCIIGLIVACLPVLILMGAVFGLVSAMTAALSAVIRFLVAAAIVPFGLVVSIRRG
jgi:hypothetical protein